MKTLKAKGIHNRVENIKLAANNLLRAHLCSFGY